MYQIVNRDFAQTIGGVVAKDAAELRIGLLGKLDSSGEVDLCTSDDVPSGVVVTNRTQIYRPTDAYAADAESVTLLNGHLQVVADASFFEAASLPSFGANLYTGTGGLMHTSGAASGFIGKVIRTGIDMRAVPNTTKNLVMCELHIASA
jgi:hypothetical protein